MKENLTQVMLAVAAIAFLSAVTGRSGADEFGGGENAFELEFVTIGAPGNAADTTGAPNPAGSVPYVYRIGKFTVSEDIVNKANTEGALGITVDDRDNDEQPATGISWFEAATFTNWLNTSTGHQPAYKFSEQGEFQLWQPEDAGYDAANQYRNALAYYFLPSADEYYKAAFYDPVAEVYYDYPTGSDSEPVPVAGGTTDGTAVYGQIGALAEPAEVRQAGGLSPFGTIGQGGNIWQWQESEIDAPNDSASPTEGRVVRGGSWAGAVDALRSDLLNPNNPPPTVEFNDLGFRVASVPEPDSLVLLVMGLILFSRRPGRRTLRGL